MYGVVTLLDDACSQHVADIWAELANRFGLCSIAETPYPHFSYQVAEHYDLDALAVVLSRFAQNSGSFTAKTSGLGLFTGTRPVLYVPVVRSTALTRFHRELWPELAKTTKGVLDYYHPEHWIPHITLAQSDLTPELLPRVVGWLSTRHFSWEVPVNNLSLIHDTGTGQELRYCFEW